MFNTHALVLLVSLFMALGEVQGQILITEDFSDGDLSTNPSWQGDTAYFEVTSAGELRLQDSLAGVRSLVTSSVIGLDASWEMRCRLDFNPSSSNYLKVYLMSDNSDINGSLQGYFLKVGGSTSDRIGLYRQDLKQSTLLAESSMGWVNTDPLNLRIRVTRNPSFYWEVFADTAGAVNLQLVGSAYDSTYVVSNYFGLCPNYTRTRADRFYFDDFVLSGFAYVDSVAPRVTGYDLADSLILELYLSEPVDTALLHPGSFILSDGLKVTKVTAAGNILWLESSKDFENKRLYGLAINSIRDLAGNLLDTTISFRRIVAEPGDVIISELMADPAPSVGIPPWGLPEVEYIEVCNTLPYSVKMSGWQLNIGSREIELPDVHLDSSSYMLFTMTDAIALFGDSISITGLDMPSSVLNNQGTSVSLLNQSGNVVSKVTYDTDYYRNQLKAQGGWSLELVHPGILCEDAANWMASRDNNGGTPGRPNSTDSSDYLGSLFRIQTMELVDEESIKVSFSRPMAYEQTDSALIHVWPDLVVTALSWHEYQPGQVEIKFDKAMSKSQVYFLSPVSTLVACDRQPIGQDTILFGLPEEPEPGEVLINELLFDPWPDGVDFVELYNASDKILDLSKLSLGNWDNELKQAFNTVSLSDVSSLWLPGQYLLATEDYTALENQYQLGSQCVISVLNLPSLPDNNGSVAVQTSSLKVIDYLEYDHEMHHPLLSDPEGVSLERLSRDLLTSNLDNWHSAAGSVGFATPGYKNSQRISINSSAKISISPKVFTPNLDGRDDVLSIAYQMAHEGAIANVRVWEPEGYQVRTIADQLLLGAEGVLIWDGTTDNGVLARPGIYIVVFEYFTVDEKRNRTRRTCVLSR